MRVLKKGDEVELLDGSLVKVLTNTPLGKGGQGIIYKVDWNGNEYALKWYTNSDFFGDGDNVFQKNLLDLIDRSKKHEDLYENYTMPIEVTKLEPDGQFGYVMKIITGKNSLTDILGGRCNFKDVRTQYKACAELAATLGINHVYHRGLMDINEDGIFFDLNTGDVSICDCDNISSEDYETGIGRVGYMAPEVYRGECKCSELTDRHSLAVLFYHILIRGNPFEGTLANGIVDESLEKKLYANPVFVFDPDDNSNRTLDPEEIERWESLPDNIRELFLKTFTVGLSNPDERTQSTQWFGSLILAERIIAKDPILNNMPFRPVPKKPQPLLFVIDSSYSMNGSKMDEVNNAIRDSLETLKDLEYNNNVVTFEIAVLQFSKYCTWSSDHFEKISKFNFSPLSVTGRPTRFDLACIELDSHLTKEKMLKYDGLYRKPLIILLSDGVSTKSYDDYIEELWNNKNFKKSIKIAIGVFDKDDSSQENMTKMLEAFTGNPNMVVETSEIEGKLGELIHNITIRVSEANAKSTDQERIEKALLLEKMVR